MMQATLTEYQAALGNENVWTRIQKWSSHSPFSRLLSVNAVPSSIRLFLLVTRYLLNMCAPCFSC